MKRKDSAVSMETVLVIENEAIIYCAYISHNLYNKQTELRYMAMYCDAITGGDLDRCHVMWRMG